MLKKLMLLIPAFAVAMAMFASSAFAYGQCGSGTNNTSTWVSQLNAEGVTGPTSKLMAYAGFHRMDGSFAAWVSQRVVAVTLRKPADPVDYGCHHGVIFSVGHRELPAGTPVFAVLPLNDSKSNISLVPRKGYERKGVCTNAAGKQNCTNPEKGTFCYWIYVPIPHKKVVPPKKHKPAPKKHKKPVVKKKPAPTPAKCGTAGTSNSSNSGTACQSGTATSTATTTQTPVVAPTCSNSPNSPNQCSPTVTTVSITIINTTVINANCSLVTYSDGTTGYVLNGSPVTICGTTTTTPPPAPTCAQENETGIYPACYSAPTVVNITLNQEYYTGETGLTVCAITTGDVTSVQFSAQYGSFADGGLVSTPLSTNAHEFCDNTYSSPDDIPPSGNDSVTGTVVGPGGTANKTVSMTILNAPAFE